jgi:hypothetical protein
VTLHGAGADADATIACSESSCEGVSLVAVVFEHFARCHGGVMGVQGVVLMDVAGLRFAMVHNAPQRSVLISRRTIFKEDIEHQHVT